MSELFDVFVNRISSKTLSYMVENNVLITPENYRKWYKVFSYMEKNNKDTRSPQELYLVLNKNVEDMFEIGELFLEYKEKTSGIISGIENLIIIFGAVYEAIKREKRDGYSSPYIDFICSKLKLMDSIFSDIKRLSNSLQEIMDLFESDMIRIIEEFSIDPLTGVYTRRAFFDYLNKMFSAAERNKDFKFSLILIDIDYFKEVNDTYGHEGGDVVLKEIGSLLKSFVRAEDFVGRIGGEEFGIIINFSNAVYACKVAERIRKQIEQHKFIVKKNKVVNLTASFGVVDSEKFSSLKDMVSTCDSLLYVSKNFGRNRVTCRL